MRLLDKKDIRPTRPLWRDLTRDWRRWTTIERAAALSLLGMLTAAALLALRAAPIP